MPIWSVTMLRLISAPFQFHSRYNKSSNKWNKCSQYPSCNVKVQLVWCCFYQRHYRNRCTCFICIFFTREVVLNEGGMFFVFVCRGIFGVLWINIYVWAGFALLFSVLWRVRRNDDLIFWAFYRQILYYIKIMQYIIMKYLSRFTQINGTQNIFFTIKPVKSSVCQFEVGPEHWRSCCHFGPKFDFCKTTSQFAKKEQTFQKGWNKGCR